MVWYFLPELWWNVVYTHFGDYSLWKWEAVEHFNQERGGMQLTLGKLLSCDMGCMIDIRINGAISD